MKELRENQNWRRTFSAYVCIVATFFLYAPTLALAWSSVTMACCTGGECPIAAHHHRAPEQKQHEGDCTHNSNNTLDCSMSCCQPEKSAAANSVNFLLPPVTAVVHLTNSNSKVEIGSVLEIQRFDEPVAPPPRIA